jgi:hypothetical protein
MLVSPADDIHWSARHGAHGRFDLDRLREPLSEAGFDRIDGGALAWLSLHFLRATKGVIVADTAGGTRSRGCGPGGPTHRRVGSPRAARAVSQVITCGNP